MARGSERMWWWVFGPIVAVAALLGGGWWWIVSDADWRRAQARATAEGIPIALSEVMVPFDERSASDLASASTIAKTLMLPDAYDERTWREGFQLLAMHQVEKLDALDAAVDRLPWRLVDRAPDPRRSDRIDRVLVARVLVERAICWPVGETAARVRRAAHFITATNPRYWWSWTHRGGIPGRCGRSAESRPARP